MLFEGYFLTIFSSDCSKNFSNKKFLEIIKHFVYNKKLLNI